MLKDFRYWIHALGFYISILVQSIFPFLISSFFIYKISKIDILIFFICFLFSINLFIVDFESAIQFIIYVLMILIISQNYTELKSFLKPLAYLTIIFLIYSFSLESININSGRYWKIMNNGYELNPNFLGLISGIAFIYFFKYGARFFSIIPFIFLVICQSRSALLVVVIFLLMSTNIRFKSILSLILFSIIGYLSLLSSGFMNRVKEDGENGRFERFSNYWDYYTNYLPLSLSKEKMILLKDNYGNLDNLYLNLILRFGFGGILILLIIFWKAYNNRISREKFAMLIALLVHGLFESSFFGAYFILSLLAISISKTERYSKDGSLN